MKQTNRFWLLIDLLADQQPIAEYEAFIKWCGYKCHGPGLGCPDLKFLNGNLTEGERVV